MTLIFMSLSGSALGGVDGPFFTGEFIRALYDIPDIVILFVKKGFG